VGIIGTKGICRNYIRDPAREESDFLNLGSSTSRSRHSARRGTEGEVPTMDGWTGIISILSLLSGNLDGIVHKPFPTETECNTSIRDELPDMQRRFDAGPNKDKIKLIGRCVKTVPEDSF
jgi:hypothetical protein